MLRRPLTNDFNSRRLPSKRSLQSLLTPEQMNIAIQRESARADRNGGEFALVLFRGRSADRAALSSVRLAKTVLRRVRATDDIGWFDDQHIAALLPDTSAAGAWRFADQVCMMLSRRAPRPLCSVYSYPTKWFSGDDNGSGESSNGNGNGNGLTRGNEVGADGRPLGVGNLIPYFLDG